MTSDRSLVEPGCSVKDVEMRERGREFDEPPLVNKPKSANGRDLGSEILTEENNKCNVELSDMLLDHITVDCGSEVSVATTSVLTDKLGTECTSYRFGHGATCLSLGHDSSMKSSLSLALGGTSASSKHIDSSTDIPCIPIEYSKENSRCNLNPLGFGVDLNLTDASTVVEDNPFYPYKKLGQVRSSDDSECASTTGPVKERDPLIIWKEMKQNGFLSSSRGGIPVPKQRCRQPKKKKEIEPRKKAEALKREHINRFTKVAAPSGLLSGLNPGIINHVRNSKQVHAIIEAIVQSEKADAQSQVRGTDQENSGQKKKQNTMHELSINQFNSLFSRGPPFASAGYRGMVSEMGIVRQNSHQGASTSFQLSPDHEDDVLKLKLSSATALISENASSSSTNELPTDRENISSLTIKAAAVASHWLELLQMDIKGRLAALRRSRKRVKNVMQTELPYLLSTEFTSNQENDPSLFHPAGGCSRKAIPEKHVAHWKSLFTEMDKALYEEGKHLESWLRQVQEMQSHCENGLKFMGLDCLPQMVSSDILRKLGKGESLDREYAVQAAAASLYSTCNMIMTTENPPHL